LLSSDQVGELREIGPFEASEGLIRLERGDCCYVVRSDGRLAHYSWVQRSGSHPITEAGLSSTVGTGEFWIYNCRTADWARGLRIYPSVLVRIVNEHFAQGNHTAWIYTSSANIASQKGILRAGFVQVATLRALRAGTHYFRISPKYQGQ
jgi:hypothetical protein